MGYDGGERTNWTRVAVVLIGLFVAFFVVSFILKLVKLLLIGGLIFIGVLVVLRAIRPRR